MVMVMTAVSIVISVIVLDLHHHEPTHHVPNWLRRLVFGFFARMLCIYTPYTQQLLAESKQVNRNASSRYNGNSAARRRNSSRDKCSRNPSSCSRQQRFCEEEEGMIKATPEQNGVDGVNLAVRYLYDDLETATRAKAPALEEILQHLRGFSAKMKNNIKRDSIKEEWQMLAKVIDRFLLVIFLLAISSLTLIILYIYPQIAMQSHTCKRDH